MTSQTEDLASLVRELADALRPFANKHLFPEDIDGWQDNEWLVVAQKDDTEFDEVFIPRGWIRKARAVLARVEAQEART